MLQWQVVNLTQTRQCASSAHHARDTVAFLHFIGPKLWHPNSLDRKLDYKVWCRIEEKKCHMPVQDMDNLKQWVIGMWSGMQWMSQSPDICMTPTVHPFFVLCCCYRPLVFLPVLCGHVTSENNFSSVVSQEPIASVTNGSGPCESYLNAYFNCLNGSSKVWPDFLAILLNFCLNLTFSIAKLVTFGCLSYKIL